MLANEQSIIEDAKSDPDAFGLLFDAYYEKIYSYAYRRLFSAEYADDITAETFTKAYQNIHSFTWRGHSILNWLYAIAGNEIRMHLRKKSNHNDSLDEVLETIGYEPVSEVDLEQDLIDEETKKERQAMYSQTRTALLSLKAKYQEVLHLHYIENVSVADIAKIIDKKEGTVKSILHRGRKMLHEALVINMQPESASSIIAIGGTQLINSEEQS